MREHLQDIYASFLKEKTAVMRRQLQGLDDNFPVCSIAPSPLETGFRNRAKFKIYHQNDTNRIMGTDPIHGEVPAEESLWILPEWGRECVRAVHKIISENGAVYPVDGFEIQLTHGRKDCHVILSVKNGTTGVYGKFADMLLKTIPELIGVAIPSKNKEFGEIFLNHRILGLNILAHYRAFFQANSQLLPKLLQHVKLTLKMDRFKRLVDLYCGVGLFSLTLKERASEFIGADNSKWAVKSAEINGKHLDSHKMFFRCTSVETFLDTFPLFRDDLVILNPPRQGVSPVIIETIASLRPRILCLVSCCLETHLRDLRLWRDSGYSIRSLSAFDMFPFSDFLETVTVLES